MIPIDRGFTNGDRQARVGLAATGANDDQTSADPDQATADPDQTRADNDQTGADQDQTGADRDQAASDRDQRTADADQADSDLELARGHGHDGYLIRRHAREESTQARQESSRERLETAWFRESTAEQRDLAAVARDRTADSRDREADARDRAAARLAADGGSDRPITGTEILLQAARDRTRAAAGRVRAAAQRAEAAHDRELAARDRKQAAEDRAQAAAAREAAALDVLTGAWQRGPGLGELQRLIDRSRRGTSELIVAYVDVDGLKATNDNLGHQAGDALLASVVAAMRAHLRSYEPIIRLGGDEFLCALSDAPLESVRGRFAEISAGLAKAGDHASISVGFAELTAQDSPEEVIARADADLLATKRARRAAGNAARSRL
ncbi:MAG: GGDEF domain-containing protein [Solirubrobacteraceae bacterium]